MAFWEVRSALDGCRDEYRGWRKFRRTTGVWPIYSILASVTTIPILFAVGVYAFIAFIRALDTINTYRLPQLYAVLFVLVLGSGLLWYMLRRLANYADLSRVQKLASRDVPATVERFIR